MIYALDTNIISFLLRPSMNPEVVKRFEEIIAQGHDYVIPPLCHFEISWYLIRKKATKQTRIFGDIYSRALTKTRMEEAEVIKAAEIRADLDERGLPIGSDADIFIAAHCIVNGYTLVTDNTKDFINIGHNLILDNWKEQT